jgi:hypothetical protein
LSTLQGARNPFEDLGDASAVQSGIVECGGENLAGQLDLLDLPLRREFGELASVHAVESNIDPPGSSLHAVQDTGRAPTLPRSRNAAHSQNGKAYTSKPELKVKCKKPKKAKGKKGKAKRHKRAALHRMRAAG